MNLPKGFSITAPGAVTTVSCDACHVSSAHPYHHEPLERWAEEHRCGVPTDGDRGRAPE
jgi:hypothetical protein